MDGYATPTYQQQGHSNHGPGRGQSPQSHPRGTERGQLRVPMPAKVEEALLSVPADATSPLSPGGDGTLDPVQKKIRNLSKKLKAIDELKEKAQRGEKLETTQHKKIESEAEIRKELNALMASNP